MDGVDHNALIGDVVTELIEGLSPFVNDVFSRALPPGSDWTEVLRMEDVAGGRRGGEYRSHDLSLMFRAMTERLGSLGYLFSRHMPRQADIYARELAAIRDRWAHDEPFSATEAARTIDTAELLLRAVGADGQAARVAALKTAIASGARVPSAEELTEVRGGTASNDDVPIPPAESGSRTAEETARIAVDAVTDLSYAMAHCRIPVIDHITVDNVGADVRGAVVEVGVVSAHGSHGGPREVHLDLAAHKPTVLRNVDLQLDPASMLTVDEQRPGQIRIALQDAAGSLLAESAKDVNILAANQWKATPPQLALEMLAAYVQPNSTAVSALMPDVSDRLRDATGSSAIDGYQTESPDRVDAIARAVFDAMRARDIRYAEPPASWGDDGQKVRTPADVLDGRLGTCLDTTLTMAAILEQAGINSTIWILKGHAFLGYWRIDGALEAISTTEVVDVVNQVDLGNVRLVETTMVAQSAGDPTFAEAVSSPRLKYLSGDLGVILGVTDIRQARRARIFPLPSRGVDADGEVVVTHYVPGAGPAIAPYVPAAGVRRSPQAGEVPARIGQWKNALLDLSLRNKLINYTDKAGFRIDVPGPALGRFEDAVNATARITLLPSDSVKNVDVARGIRFGRDLPERERELLLADNRAYIDVTDAAYQTKLRYLAYKAKTIVEETGANNLYLAFGMLNWHFNDRELRSPLVLVPVALSTANRGERYVLKLDEAGASTPNYCLVEKLRLALNLELPGLADPAEDESGIDLIATFDSVRRAIADAGLHFRVEETVHLSILQFAKFPLWKDLDESWKDLSRNTLVKHLIETPTDPFTDPVAELPAVDLDQLAASVPVAADSSQLRAVADAVGGRTFVLEGPPGTGKSQTITNLLAYAMASGRRVLFVAEKRAALDVVKKRLEDVGLGQLSLDLHDKSARPSAVRTQIKEALELRISSDKDLLKTSLQAAESSRHSLARYAQRLHEHNAAGHSLYSARSAELAADRGVRPLGVPRGLVAGGSPEVFEVVGQTLRMLAEKVDLARPRRDHPWGFIDAWPAQGLKAGDIHATAVEFDQCLGSLQQAGVPIDKIGRAGGPTAIGQWAALANQPRFPLQAIDALHTAQGKAWLDALDMRAANISGMQPRWLSIATPAAMDLDIPAVHEAAVAADQSGFFGRKKRRRAVLERLANVLAVDGSTVDVKTLSAVTDDMNSTYALVAELRGLVPQLPVALFERPWNPLVPADVAHLRDSLATLSRLGEMLSVSPESRHVADLREYYGSSPRGTLSTELTRFSSAYKQLAVVTATTDQQREIWSAGSSFVEQWWATREARRLDTTVSIERWLDLVEHIEPLRGAAMDGARAEILAGGVVADDAALAFDRGIAVASIAERLDASALGDFDVTAHNKTIQRFTAAAGAIRDELHRSIPAQLLEARRFDAEASSGQVGGLRRQLDRKRGGMSVRMLMDNYGELITQILPCTLMSPDSVARFFPARSDLFDVVVFDEASQIRVADAIGAMGRARSVVVVGDSKQMPPTSFAETSANLDDEEEYNPDIVLDEESILTECVQGQVPQQRLSWHYRSQDEALIAFSNIHYYNGDLASFPAPLAQSSGHGISLIRVNGHFERSGRGKTLRTNRVEAEHIVDDIRRRFAASPDSAPSLGVITFNAPQRDLVENLLRDAGDDRLLQALDEPDGLFVKNLENVQGDERDTILFSVAFSRNDKGVVPLNFGPLSRPGGERRLNVAITRARREVLLYSSFDPAELRAEETSQIGTKHLKAYLEMAARGVETITQGGRRQPVIDRHRDDIAAALRDEGFVVSTDVGLSDFRVDIVIADPDQPQQPLVAVLLDGAEWFARKTVADRDGLPVDVLVKLMKWPAVERVWMPEWLNHRGETIARLVDAVEVAKGRVQRGEAEVVSKSSDLTYIKPVEVTSKPAPAVEPTTFAVLRSSPGAVQTRRTRHQLIQSYRAWIPPVGGDVSTLDQLPNQWAKNLVRSVVDAAINAEAPIHKDRLAKVVAGAFGLSRVSEERRRAIQRLVPADYARQADRDFYWPKGVEPTSWRIVRQPKTGSSRPIAEVSLFEIGNAMVIVAEQSGGVGADELKREALALFGGVKLMPAVSARLDDALAHAIGRGLLRQTGIGLYQAVRP